MNTTDGQSLDAQICGTIRTSPQAQRLMNTLCHEIGPRSPGSPAMQAAQRLLGDELMQIGSDNMSVDRVEVFSWQDAGARVELISPFPRSFESYHCVHSAAGRVEGQLIDAGFATEAEFDALGSKARNAIVLLHGFESGGAGGIYVPIQQRIANAIRRGAAGVIVRSLPGTGLPTVELIGVARDVSVPVVSISAEAGTELAFAAKSSEARSLIEGLGTSATVNCANLIADITGRKDGQQIILSAHLDTFHNNPGAFDNLTGVLTLIEVARALAGLRSHFRRRLRLVIFTGEEYGFIGSKAYVNQHRGELKDVAFVFNMDSLFPETAKGIAVMGSPRLRDYVDAALAGTNCQVDVRNLFCMSSDYLPFVLAGIPAARPAQWHGEFPPQSHTIADMPDRICIDWIRQNAMMVALMLVRALTDAELPALPHRSAEDVAEELRREGLTEHLRLYGFDV